LLRVSDSRQGKTSRRRLSLDLIGLLPTLETIDTFFKDTA
jgi:hypothetical protein